MPASALMALFMAATAALLALALVYLRQQAVHSGERLIESFAQVIGEQTSRTFQAVDDRLKIAAGRLRALQAEGRLNERSARLMLREELRGLPFVRAIWVLDREGRIVLDSDEGNIGLSLADRAYFQIYRQRPDTGFFIGPAVRSRSTGTWLLSGSRPLDTPDGEFAGVIVAAVEPPYFEQIWRGVEVGQGGAVTLFGRDGRLMIRSPPDEAAMGMDFSRQPLFARYLPGSTQGVFVGASPVDGLERMTAYRVLASYPELVVAVGSPYAAVLAPWRRFAMLTFGVWAIAVLTAGGLAWQLRLQSLRRQRNEFRFRELAQAMPQIVLIADLAGDVHFINDRWLEATGHPVDEAAGEGWLEFIHPDDRESTREALHRMAGNPGELQYEQRLRYADGAYRWQLLRALPARDRRGEVSAWYATLTDIDEMKQAQTRLTNQTELLSMAGRLARMGGWVIDVDTQRITWSAEAAAVLDLPAGSSPTVEQILAWLMPGSHELALEGVRACMADGTPFDVEVEMVTATGRTVWVRSIGQAVRNAQGRVVRVEGAQQDITQRVLMVQQIRQLNAGLEEKIAERTQALRLANEQLQSFSYSVSHDLQSPLQRIASFAQLLQQEIRAEPGSRAQHFLSRIRANTDYMAELINGLLALARVSDMEMICGPVDLSALAQEILERLQGEQPERAVAWQVQPGLSGQGDVRLMRSVLENLLGNAWKFTSQQRRAEVSVGGASERGEFFVRDNGAGFDMAYAGKLFGTFQRLHGPEFPGTGIGLGTVARAIARQGGRVWAHGEKDLGATFYFTLPVVRPRR